jgi:hypothetical protein
MTATAASIRRLIADPAPVRHACLAALLAACGGGPLPCRVHCGHYDAAPPDAPACDVLAQTGCHDGEKCTWIMDYPGEGHIGCAPNGTRASDDTCEYGQPGATGYDDCTAGLVCNAGTCAAICATATTCDASHVCIIDHDLFANHVGRCARACDPLADNDALGSGQRGGACVAGQGCYGYPTPQGTTWTCQLELHPDLVHGSPCTITNGCLASPTSSFANACAQGYLPIDIGYNGATLVACAALCSPGNTYAGNPDPQYPIGRTPHTCSTADARGTFDPSTQCMFSWWFERGGAPTPTSNTVGLCIDHAALGWPDCATLSVTDAATFGCVDTAHASL